MSTYRIYSDEPVATHWLTLGEITELVKVDGLQVGHLYTNEASGFSLYVAGGGVIETLHTRGRETEVRVWTRKIDEDRYLEGVERLLEQD